MLQNKPGLYNMKTGQIRSDLCNITRQTRSGLCNMKTAQIRSGLCYGQVKFTGKFTSLNYVTGQDLSVL